VTVGALSVVSYQIPLKKAPGIAGRGWTDELIQETLNNPVTTRTSTNMATMNEATVFYRADGSHIVRDNITTEVFHGSKIGDPDWVPDSRIINPWKP
jgi:hypothetical protein